MDLNGLKRFGCVASEPLSLGCPVLGSRALICVMCAGTCVFFSDYNVLINGGDVI
jgi:hypothetical protein